MKTLLLLFALTAASFLSSAQSCTPGLNFADSTGGGFWPDTVTNFPPASIGCSYSTNINFNFPSTITDEIAAVIPEAAMLVGSPIQSFKITDVSGLPAGFSYACNISSCEYLGGSNGCSNVYGTTSAPAGSYPVSIEVDITVLISLFPGLPPTPITQSTSFDGYSIELGSAGNTTTSVTSCGSYTWNGTTYTASGAYTGTTANCVTQSLNLTIIPSSTITTTATSCNSYVWNGTNYTASGVYSGTTTNCVTESLNLTITPNSTNTTTVTACNSYTWNGQTYTQSGVYSGTTANCITESLNLTIPTLPTQNICVVGLDSLTNNIRLVWEKPLTTAIDSFYIYKESNVADVYSQIGSRAYDSLSIWIDPISNPAVQAYRYKITAFDTCGVETPLSDYHKTMHLTINQGVGGAWNLIWSHYEGINFSSYRIYRGTSLSNMALLTTIQNNLNSYTDLNPPTGLVYYQIEIINPNNCSPTKSINYSSSKSNITSNGQNDLLVITSDYISIFPNPTTSKITVKSLLELIGKEFTIYDQLGKEVMSGLITSEETEIDLSNISEGVYLFKVGTEMQETFRIIKQ